MPRAAGAKLLAIACFPFGPISSDLWKHPEGWGSVWLLRGARQERRQAGGEVGRWGGGEKNPVPVPRGCGCLWREDREVWGSLTPDSRDTEGWAYTADTLAPALARALRRLRSPVYGYGRLILRVVGEGPNPQRRECPESVGPPAV